MSLRVQRGRHGDVRVPADDPGGGEQAVRGRAGHDDLGISILRVGKADCGNVFADMESPAMELG